MCLRGCAWAAKRGCPSVQPPGGGEVRTLFWVYGNGSSGTVNFAAFLSHLSQMITLASFASERFASFAAFSFSALAFFFLSHLHTHEGPHPSHARLQHSR